MLPNDQNFLSESSDHRGVLRRLIEVAGDRRRLVTPSEMMAHSAIELGGQVYPAGVRPPQLVNLLDDLVGIQLAERIVPAAGESSYRPTEHARERLDACLD